MVQEELQDGSKTTILLMTVSQTCFIYTRILFQLNVLRTNGQNIAKELRSLRGFFAPPPPYEAKI